jgi:hypothetical protein
MLFRTEYRGQRYSLGSSDPLPAGFKIRFWSLNFQATGNGYLMRITNRGSSTRGGRPGQNRSPSRLVSMPRRPPKRTPRALSTTTPPTLRPALSTGADGTTPGRTCRLATRHARQRDDNRTRACGF